MSQDNGIETSLMLHLEQIGEGDATCEYCEEPAVVTVGTGADPEPAPACWQHGRSHLGVMLSVGDGLWG